MWVNRRRQARTEHSVGHSGHAQAPLLTRFVSKFVLDILPAALASVVGGILFAQFHVGNSPASQQLAQPVSPASAEVLALVRDEHAEIVGYLKSQMIAEKKRLADEDEESARAVEDTKVEKLAEQKATEEQVALAEREKAAQDTAAAAEKATDPNAAGRLPVRHSAASSASKPTPTLPRARPAAAAVAASGAPLVIAQAEQDAQPDDAGPSNGQLARDPDSLLAKTLDLKDQVVAATRHAVSAIGDVFNSVGEHIGGALPSGHQFSSDS